ncbi:MAG: hypothetical protein ACXVHB_28480 [Solirubrobacteraceae bacterium]
MFALSGGDAEIVGALIGACATVLGVAVALWIALGADDWRRRRTRPVLSIEVVRTSEHAVRLRVKNAAGKEPAENVELLLVDIEHHPTHQLLQPPKMASSIEDVNRAFQWSDGSVRINIPPGLQRDVAVATIQGWLGDPAVGPTAAINLPDGPRELVLTLGGQDREYFLVPYLSDETKNAPARLRLALVGDNVTAAYYTLEIGWPWDAPWWAMVARGAFTAELRLGWTERSGSPYTRGVPSPWADPDDLPPPPGGVDMAVLTYRERQAALDEKVAREKAEEIRGEDEEG